MITVNGDAPACAHGADGLAAELAAITVLALDRLEPLLVRLRDLAADGATPCPVCAVLDAVRDHRPEAGRVAEHAAGLLTALRAVLDGRFAAPQPTGARPSGRRVQHIPVERVPAADGVSC